MTAKFLRKKLRVFRRHLRGGVVPFVAGMLLLGVVTVGYAMRMNNQQVTVKAETYTPLLNLIGRIESNDNYNAYFGNAGNQEIKFTDMPIKDVLSWQSNFVAQGNASSAVGRYQIINTTLDGLVRRLNLDTNQKFDPATQDRLAIALIERRGSINYVAEQLAPEQFAANLAKEWAALPKVVGDNPNASYYAGDGLNKSRTSVDEVLKVIEPISAE